VQRNIIYGAVKQNSHKFLTEPDRSILYTDFYPAFAGFAVLTSLFGENKKLSGAVTDLYGFRRYDCSLYYFILRIVKNSFLLNILNV